MHPQLVELVPHGLAQRVLEAAWFFVEGVEDVA